MLSVYRKGDIIVVALSAAVRPGDRVVVKTRSGEVLAKQLSKATARQVRLASVNRSHEDICLPAVDVVWISRSFGLANNPRV